MSVLEFVGCLSAMVGGVVLGSMYLGVDVRQMTFAVLKQAKLVDAGAAVEAKPDVQATAAGEAASSAAADGSPTSSDESPAAARAAEGEQGATTAPAEETAESVAEPAAVVEPSSEAPADATGAESPAPAEASNPLANFLSRENAIDLTDAQRATLTHAYWEALDQCMKDEVKHRLAGMPEDGNWQLFDYLSCRKQGHEQAASLISQLNLRGVDAHVASYAQKALAWHRDGVKLFSRALDLLTDAPTAQLSGPFAQSWQSAATQHQMEERLLGEKHTAVQSYLAHSATAEATVATEASVEPPSPASDNAAGAEGTAIAAPPASGPGN
jgi:hypothetical protein